MKYLVALLLFVTVGCAAYKSYNQEATGRVILRGGYYKKESWPDSLVLKRMSWYHGMTLYYDILLWKADPSSPFAKWFSPTEMELFDKCENLLVTAGYSADPNKISHVNFREQMKLNGYDDIVLTNFSTYLRGHPSAPDWRLQNYKILGYCKRSPTTLENANLIINFPGFKQLEIRL